MTFKLIDAAIILAKEQAETLRFKVRDCKSQQELENLRVDLQKIMSRIDTLTDHKAKRLEATFTDKFKNV
jgi:hypothetical protein